MLNCKGQNCWCQKFDSTFPAMSGIRVSTRSYEITDKDLKIHFSKPENGGGTIQAIYFPLFDYDAVIMFEDEHTADITMSYEHSINDIPMIVDTLPLTKAFSLLTAKVDPTALKILQSTQEVLDEVKHLAGLDYHYNRDTNEATLTGNWYQLEWVWAKIDRFMTRQKHMERQFSDKREAIDRRTSTRQLSKGSKPVKGDTMRPLISMPGTSNSEVNVVVVEQDDEDDDDDDDAGIDVKAEYVKQDQNKPSHVPEYSGSGSRTNAKREELLSILDRKLPENMSKSKTLPIRPTQSKHVSFTSGEANTHLTDETEDSKVLHIINDKPDDMRSLEFRYGGLTVHICTGEITMVETEVIVNAAMGPLVNAGGVAKAISSAASPDMQRECDAYVEQHGSVPTSEVMHTCAGGRLSPNVKHILHAVGPVWSAGSLEHEARFLLTRTFLNCYNYANDRVKVTSMTLPVISSGIFGCPLEICIRAFVDAILIFTAQHNQEPLLLKEVTLINNNGDNTALTVMQVRELLSNDLQALTNDAVTFYNKMDEKDNRPRRKLDEQKATDKSRTFTQRSLTDTSQKTKEDKESHTTVGRPLPPVPQAGKDSKGKKK